MTSNEALLRVGMLILDEVSVWHRACQTTYVGSEKWMRAQGAFDALNALSSAVFEMLQREAMEDAGLPVPTEPTALRVIIGGKAE